VIRYRQIVEHAGRVVVGRAHAGNLGQLQERASAHGANDPDWTRTGYAPDPAGGWRLDRAAFIGINNGAPVVVTFVALSQTLPAGATEPQSAA
jgi:hypothetical protein